ncbi:MAG: BspA family leucine-rich repeat surface protein, partial [Clostridia bacterium]|nr:BspA family leucine-rich repeat surface protein [Clostridia bacterium]
MQGYNITYVMNDVDSPVAAPRKTSYVEGETLSYSALPNKTNGAEFLGWTYTGENVEPLEEPTLNLTLPNTTTGDLTLTAHWGSTMQDGYTLFNTFHQAFFSHSEYKSDEIMGEYIESYSNLDGLIFDFWNAEYEEEFGNYKSGSRINDVLGDIRVFKREPYTLCILSPNKIYANTYADSLCANFYLSGFDQYHNNISTIIFNNFDTSKVSNMEGMFNRCSGLQSLDLSSFDTSKVSNMRYMFYSCSSLTSLNVNNFNTSSVTDMRYMFQDCSSLTSLDLSSFNTTNVTN